MSSTLEVLKDLAEDVVPPQRSPEHLVSQDIDLCESDTSVRLCHPINANELPEKMLFKLFKYDLDYNAIRLAVRTLHARHLHANTETHPDQTVAVYVCFRKVGNHSWTLVLQKICSLWNPVGDDAFTDKNTHKSLRKLSRLTLPFSIIASIVQHQDNRNKTPGDGNSYTWMFSETTVNIGLNSVGCFLFHAFIRLKLTRLKQLKAKRLVETETSAKT